MNWPTIWGATSLALTTFAAGALGYVEENVLPTGIPHGAPAWDHALGLAVVAGLAAVVHYYQQPPAKKAPAVAPPAATEPPVPPTTT